MAASGQARNALTNRLESTVVWASARCGRNANLSTSRLMSLGGDFVGLMPISTQEKGMEQQKRVYQPLHLPPNLHVKLDPRKFSWMTPALAAVVGYVLSVNYDVAAIDALEVIYDGAIVVLPRGTNRRMILGNYDDLVRGWKYLLASAKLTEFEWIVAESLFATKVGYWFDLLN